MRVDISRWTRIAALGVFASSIAMTGCSSGWKMPSMKMFSWSKKPPESALAGSGPSSLTYPDSPAAKQTPSTIASAAAGKAPAGLGSTISPSSALAQSAGDKTAPASYAPPSTSTASIPGYKPPATGAAASMNGYATGPYNTNGQGGAAGSLATAGALAKPATPPPSQLATATPGTAAGYAPNNPYAPPASASAGLPSTQAYGGGGVANTYYGGRPSVAPAIAAVGTSGASGSAAPQFGAPQLGAPSSTMAPPPNNFANAGSAPVVNPMTMPVNGGTYTPVGTSGQSMSAPNGLAQTAPTNTGVNNGFAMPSSQPSFGAASGVGVPAQTAAYSTPASNNATTASYRPGSTSRSTGYNFAPQGTAPAPGMPNANSAPYTANGYNNPGYSLPPSSTLNR